MLFEINTNNKELIALDKTDFVTEKVFERAHLQKAIKSNPAFLDDGILIIAEEFGEWTGDAKRRIDLLAIDRSANIVVIELKREDGAHMELQSLRYASMVSTLTLKRAAEIYEEFLKMNPSKQETNNSVENALEKIKNHIGADTEFGQSVKIILASESFNEEITTSVLWLNDQGLDICCIRLQSYKLNDHILISSQRIIPLPEAASYQIKIRDQKIEERRRSIQSRIQFLFEGKKHGIGRLALAFAKKWCRDKKPRSFEEMIEFIPDSLQDRAPNSDSHRVRFREKNSIPEKHCKFSGGNRYFENEEDLIQVGEEQYVFSNQWGLDSNGNHELIDHMRNKYGWKIEFKDRDDWDAAH